MTYFYISINTYIIDCEIVEIEKGKSFIITQLLKSEINYFKKFYLDRLIQNKLAAGRNLICQNELLPKFISFWGEPFLDVLDCNFDIDKHSNWYQRLQESIGRNSILFNIFYL